jgi:signal transduction histidine kinase
MDDHLAVMNSVVIRMQKLVEDLLDQSRFERGLITLEKERVLLQDLIVEVLHTQQAEAQMRGIQLSAHLAETQLYVQVDPARLEQVLTNLLTNGLLYTPEGGQVIISLTVGESACISICDTGGGIPAEHLAHIFDPFVRANDKVSGTGLGLSIAKQIVDMHGGEIRVESSPGEGSCFYVLLQHLGE